MKLLTTFALFTLLIACGGGKKNFQKGQELIPDTIDSSAISDTITFSDENLLIEKDTFNAAAFENPKNKSQLKTASGVEITIVENGKGFSVEKGNVLKVKYRGKLPDGEVFDASDIIGRPLPYYVGIGMSIKGWDDAFPLLREGDKAVLKIPSRLAYGKKGYGKLIPPNTDLTFEVEIVEIMKPLVTESGLQFYKTYEKAGKAPLEGQTVTIHFYGWIKDTGKMFDASHLNGKPYTFVLGKGKSLAGWNEALKMMNKGEKAILVLPPSLAYGDIGVKELVPPNSTLVYNIELIDVQ